MQLSPSVTVDIVQENQMEEWLLLLWLPDTTFINHLQCGSSLVCLHNTIHIIISVQYERVYKCVAICWSNLYALNY